MRFVFLALALASTLCAADPLKTPGPGYVPPSGLVPDAETAIAVAVAIWTPIYGAEQIQSQRPFKAKLAKGIWYVEGSLPPGIPGGVAEARISKKDGRVLYVLHGK
jgi:hypothetical protein